MNYRLVIRVLLDEGNLKKVIRYFKLKVSFLLTKENMTYKFIRVVMEIFSFLRYKVEIIFGLNCLYFLETITTSSRYFLHLI